MRFDVVPLNPYRSPVANDSRLEPAFSRQRIAKIYGDQYPPGFRSGVIVVTPGNPFLLYMFFHQGYLQSVYVLGERFTFACRGPFYVKVSAT